jgi:hypothetical protein
VFEGYLGRLRAGHMTEGGNLHIEVEREGVEGYLRRLWAGHVTEG